MCTCMSNKAGSDIWPVYISKRRGDDPINLLLLSDDEKSHYTLIKNFNGLLRKPKDHHPKIYCPYCCHGFDKRTTNDEKMKEHMQDCFTYGPMKIKLPEEGKNIIQYNDIAKQLKLPFCIYADTECLLTKLENGENKNSRKINKHKN